MPCLPQSVGFRSSWRCGGRTVVSKALQRAQVLCVLGRLRGQRPLGACLAKLHVLASAPCRHAFNDTRRPRQHRHGCGKPQPRGQRAPVAPAAVAAVRAPHQRQTSKPGALRGPRPADVPSSIGPPRERRQRSAPAPARTGGVSTRSRGHAMTLAPQANTIPALRDPPCTPVIWPAAHPAGERRWSLHDASDGLPRSERNFFCVFRRRARLWWRDAHTRPCRCTSGSSASARPSS